MTQPDRVGREPAEVSGPTAPLRRLRQWLGLERNILVMLGALLVLGMGEELWFRFVPKYLEALGATALGVALYGTLKDFLDAVYQYPGGWLADRLGRRLALVLFTLLAAAGYAVYLVAPSWEWVVAGTVLVMAWSSLTLPAVFAIIGDSLPPSRRAVGFAVQSIWKRVPIILAPPLGGGLIIALGLERGVRVGLAVTLVLALVTAVFVLRWYHEPAAPPRDAVRLADVWRSMDRHLKRLLVADCLARWGEGIPKVFVVLYVTDRLGRGEFEFGWLTSVQMAAAVLIYLPVARLSDRMDRKPFVLLTFALFALFPLAVVWASGPASLALAFAVAGLREVGEPARKALIVGLAAERTRGRSIGLYYLVRGLVVFPASLAGGWLWQIDPRLPFYVAFVVGTAGFVAYALWGPGDRPEAPSLTAPAG
jgi:MFS family permease